MLVTTPNYLYFKCNLLFLIFVAESTSIYSLLLPGTQLHYISGSFLPLLVAEQVFPNGNQVEMI